MYRHLEENTMLSMRDCLDYCNHRRRGCPDCREHEDIPDAAAATIAYPTRPDPKAFSC